MNSYDPSLIQEILLLIRHFTIEEIKKKNPVSIDNFLNISYKTTEYKATPKKSAFKKYTPHSEVVIETAEVFVGTEEITHKRKPLTINIIDTEETYLEFKPDKSLLLTEEIYG
jgi:hypothetical protein